METEKRPETETCPCQFDSVEEERQARSQLLRQHGEDLPEEAIDHMVSDAMRANWVTMCSCENPKEIVAAAHYEPVDWFLCAIKGLVVTETLRGLGLGREATQEAVDLASKDPQCLVLAADVTYDNVPSQKSLRRAGFQHVGEFCWAKGEKPADILHLVRFKPTEDMTCLEP